MYKVHVRISDGDVRNGDKNKFPISKAEAIEHSIEKWSWVRRWSTNHVGEPMPKCTNETCALCRLYYHNGTCRGCPISALTGVSNCHKTPYDLVTDQCGEPITKLTLVLIDAEIEFLKSLRKA